MNYNNGHFANSFDFRPVSILNRIVFSHSGIPGLPPGNSNARCSGSYILNVTFRKWNSGKHGLETQTVYGIKKKFIYFIFNIVFLWMWVVVAEISEFRRNDQLGRPSLALVLTLRFDRRRR